MALRLFGRRRRDGGRTRRRSLVAAALLAAIAVVAPVAATATPAQAWDAWETPTEYCELEPGKKYDIFLITGELHDKYVEALGTTARNWSSWSATTNVNVYTIDRFEDIPVGGIPVHFLIDDRLSAWAQASPQCLTSNDQLVGGLIEFNDHDLRPTTTVFTELVFTHEVGHILGLFHPQHQLRCSTAMNAQNDEHLVCDSKFPYADDAAGVAQRFNPNGTPGFPANSRILSSRGDGHALQSTYASMSGYLNNLTFTTPNTQGYFDWTFVHSKADDGAGWVVNTGSGLCLTEHRGFLLNGLYMDYCSKDAGLWFVRQVSGGIQLQNKVSGRCMGQKDRPGTFADMYACTDPRVKLTVATAPDSRTKREVPSTHANGDFVISQGASKCMAVAGGSQTSGAGLALANCDNAADRRWKHERVDGGLILSVYDNDGRFDSEVREKRLCLTAAGSAVTANTCLGGRNPVGQTWSLDRNGNLRNLSTGTCLATKNAGTAAGTELLMYSCNLGSNELWTIPDLVHTQVFSLVSAASVDKVMGTKAPTTTATDRREQTALTSAATGDSARWVYSPIAGTNGGGLLRNGENGLCARSQSGNAVAVVLDPACEEGSPEFRWAVTVRSSGLLVLQSQSGGRALDLSGGNTADGTTIQTHTLNNGTNQQWRVVPNPPRDDDHETNPTAVKITSVLSASRQVAAAPTATAGDPDPRWRAIQSGTHDSRAEWIVDLDPGSSSVVLRNNVGGVGCLEQGASNGGITRVGACAVPQAAEPQKKWNLVQNPDGTYRIVNAQHGLCLDLPNWADAEGAFVTTYQCHGGDNQSWRIEHVDSPFPSTPFVLRSNASSTRGLGLDQHGNGQLTSPSNDALWSFIPQASSDGAGLLKNVGGQCLLGRTSHDRVFSGACSPSWENRWKPIAAGHGLYILQNERTGECLDLSGGSDSESRPIYNWTCNLGNNQKWWAQF